MSVVGATDYFVDVGELILTPDPEASRTARAAMHLLAGLEWRRTITRHPSGAHGIAATEPLYGGLAMVWRAAESLLGRGPCIDLSFAARNLDDDWYARLVQALAMARGVQVGAANVLTGPWTAGRSQPPAAG